MTKKRTIHSWSIYVSYQRQTNHTHTQTQGNGQTFRLDESLNLPTFWNIYRHT